MIFKKEKCIIAICLTIAILLTGCGKETIVTLGNYLGINVEIEEIKVTDSDVENAIIDAIIKDYENVAITNRPVRNGDIANIDYSGKVDGKLFDGGTDTKYDLEIGSRRFIDSFEKQIIGMKVGQTKDIKVTFPDPYTSDNLAGKEAIFTVKVNSISGKIIPNTITDAMIKEISDTYTSVSEYRKYVRTKLEEQATNTNNENKQQSVWNNIVDRSKVENLSSSKVKYYSKLYESEYKSYAEYYGVSFEEFVTSYVGITMKEFIADKKSYAEQIVKEQAIVDAIAKEQKISITDAEYNDYLKENNISSEEEKQSGESIKDRMLYDKVVEFVTSKANITITNK